MIDDQNYVESTNPNLAKVSHPQYEFVSNFPPFLEDCEGFLGIQYDLKDKLIQEKS